MKNDYRNYLKDRLDGLQKDIDIGKELHGDNGNDATAYALSALETAREILTALVQYIDVFVKE